MQAVSETYTRLLNTPGVIKEHKITIAGTEYLQDDIVGMHFTSNTLFGKEKGPCVGQAAAGQLDVSVIPKSYIPRMAEIRLFTALCVVDHVAGVVSERSEWLQKGVFYIDTRQFDDVSGALSLHGYDAMLKASPNYIDVDEDSGSWPRKCRVVVEDIAFRMGVELDERTVLQDYDVGYMPLTSGREILGWIAAMHGANWTITDEGKLRLVPLVPTGEALNLGREMAQLETAPEFAPYTGVQFYYEDKDTIYAGTDEGRVLEIECPWATQEIADSVLENIRGYVYRPYEAAGAILDPAAELGDPITVSGTQSVLASCDTTFNALLVSDIAAPEDEEIDHEYPYEDPNRNRTRREIAQAKADINIGVDSIRATVEGVNRELSELDLEVGSIRLMVSDPSVDGYVSLSLIVGGVTKSTGLIKIDGNVDISGSLSAGELYAALGDIAQLTVESLTTSRKIPRYLEKDKSDINFVDIRDRRIALIRAWTDGLSTEQARNPSGQLLFWETDITGARIGEDGYPYINNTRVFTTTENTGHEVRIYKYQQGDRWVQTFDARNNYGPQQVWGEGDGTSSGRGRGYQEKLGLSFDIYNLGTDGKKRGVFMGNDFTSITGLRRPTAITEDGDDVVVEMEGKVTETFTRSFDSKGGLLGVTDQEGFYTAVTNPVFLPLAMIPRLLGLKSEAKEPVAYLYNGVRLPKLPTVAGYQNAVIYVIDGFYGLVFVRNSLRYNGKNVAQNPHGELTVYTTYSGPEWEFADVYDDWENNENIVPVASGASIVWANINILDENGGIYFEKSETPIPVYE